MQDTLATLPLHAAEGVDFLARARALVPTLAAHVPAVTAARRVLPETIEAYQETGLMRLLQPRRFGGSQASVGLFLETVEILAEGCASSAWVYAVMAELEWVIALLPERGQMDIWGDDPSAIAAASVAPRAIGRRTGSGWRISGRYPFASGCLHAQWAVIGARCEDAAGNEVPRLLAVKMTDIEIVDDWHALGMRGTGSCSLVLRDVFVPEHRSITMRDVVDGTPPGAPLCPDYALLRAPRYYVIPFVLPAVAFAMARKALQLVPASLRARGAAQTDVLHMQLGEAAAQIEAACLIFATRRAETVERLDAGTVIPEAEVLRNRRDVTLAFYLMRRGFDRLVALNGARTVYDGDPLQALVCDLTTITTHIVLNEEAAMVPYGRMMMERAGAA